MGDECSTCGCYEVRIRQTSDFAVLRRRSAVLRCLASGSVPHAGIENTMRINLSRCAQGLYRLQLLHSDVYVSLYGQRGLNMVLLSIRSYKNQVWFFPGIALVVLE